MAKTIEVKGKFDVSDIVEGFEDVGAGAKDMARDVDNAARTADGASKKMGSLADSADDVDSKSSKATSSLGALAGGLDAIGATGAATALEGTAIATDFVSGAGEGLNLILELQTVKTIRAKAATIAHSVAQKAQAAGAKVAAAGQWALNAALSANPIGLVVAGIVALVAGLVLAYNKSETFRNIVDKAMSVAKAAVEAVVDKVSDLVDWVGDKATAIWPKLSGAVDVAKTLIVGYIEVITLPIRTLIDLVGKLIDKLKNIKLPDLPDIPGVDIPFVRTAGGGTAALAAGGTVQNFYITGAVDPFATARQIRGLGSTYATTILGNPAG